MKAIEIVQHLREGGFQAFFVGGAVRDTLLKIPYSDIDIATNAKPDQVLKLFKENKAKQTGKSFGVVRVGGIEVSTFRTDSYLGLRDKDVEIKFSDTIEEDLQRRDFTINAMAMCPTTGETIDPLGGKDDLENKIIRFTHNPEHRIFEDPNRIIRACRFRAKINGEFEKETKEALIQYADYVNKYVDKERIRFEILKAMSIPNASLFFKSLHEIGALIYILPSLENCFEFPGGWWHNEDVFTHAMAVGDAIDPRFKYLKLVGYVHDVGKPISAFINKYDDFSFKGHDRDGAKVLSCELRKLKFSNWEIKYINDVVRLHMHLIEERMKPKAVRRYLIKLRDCHIDYRDMVRLRIADKKGNSKDKNYTLKEIQTIIGVIRKEVDQKSDRLELKISGKDIMRIIGIPQGKEVGKVKRYLEEIVVDDPSVNTPEKLKEVLWSMRE